MKAKSGMALICGALMWSSACSHLNQAQVPEMNGTATATVAEINVTMDENGVASREDGSLATPSAFQALLERGIINIDTAVYIRPRTVGAGKPNDVNGNLAAFTSAQTFGAALTSRGLRRVYIVISKD